LSGDGSPQIIVVQPQASKICQLSKFGRNGPRQSAIGHTDRCQLIREANFSWDSTSDEIAVDPKGN
jgi:hypothetical protein